MQKAISTEIVQLDRSSDYYKKIMSEYLKIEILEKGEEVANESFENVNEEFTYGTKTTYKFDNGFVKSLIQLNFLSPTFKSENPTEYSGHIQNWSLLACEEEENLYLVQSMELSVFCMHEGVH